MHIGIIGTGRVAQALTPRLKAAGHDILLGSRTPQDKGALPAPVVGFGELAGADLLINATPGSASLDTLALLDARVLKGKVLLDVANAANQRFELLYPNDSLARQIQVAYPETRVVKALNTFNTSVMTDPARLSMPTSAFLSGDDADAKETVAGLISDLGWSREQQIDLGGIETARAAEHYFLLLWALAQTLKTPTFNIAVVR